MSKRRLNIFAMYNYAKSGFDPATNLPCFCDPLGIITQIVIILRAHGSRLKGDRPVDEVEVKVLQLEASQSHLAGGEDFVLGVKGVPEGRKHKRDTAS